MATELVGNETLQHFIKLLCDLNNEAAAFLKTGDVRILHKMNDTVEQIFDVQQNGEEEAYTAIEEDAQIIYKNFNAAVTMLKSNENGLADPTTAEAVRLFVHNIFDANVRIVLAYGLA
jgi:hypothetical protein